MPIAHRKLLAYGALLVMTAAAAGAAVAAETAQPLPVPAQGCSTFTDPKDDATPFNFGAPFPAGPNDPDLDITSVVLASPPGKLRAYIKVAALGEPTYGAGHLFTLSFKYKAKKLAFFGSEDAEPVQSAHSGAAGAGLPFVRPVTGASVDALNVPAAVTEVVFDTKASTVIITTDRAPIEKAAGFALPDGTAVTQVLAESAYDHAVNQTVGDTATAKDWTVGDNSCFGAPKSKLTLTVPARAIAGHTVIVSGALTDAAGKATATRTVGIALGRTKKSVTTTPAGGYRLAVPLQLNAGTYTVSGAWAGDPSLATATATARMVVLAQPTRMTFAVAPAGTSRQVTLLLVDDLGHPLAGKPVTWYVDGARDGAVRTDARGRATLGVAAGKTVKAVYAGDRIRYVGSSASRRV